MLQKVGRMGSALTVEVGTSTLMSTSPKFTEHGYDYGYRMPLLVRNHLHLPFPIPNHNSTRQRQLSLLCYPSSAKSNRRNVLTSSRLVSVTLCSPHTSTISAEEDDDGEYTKKEIVKARATITEILQESGVSKEVALKIASSSPHYCQMLIDTVRELDDYSLWSSWLNDRQHILQLQEQQPSMSDVSLSFDQKLKCVSIDKGDGGKIPFLESIGFTLVSAIHLSGLLSSQSLPLLISKVKFVKDVFFPARDDHQTLIIGKHARQMMMHLSIPIDEDLQCTISFFQKIEARRGGLEMLGCEDTSFRLLIQSFPRLLLSSIQPYITGIVDFLQNIGIPKPCVGRVLLLYPPIIFLDIEKHIKPSIQAFHKVGIIQKQFGKMVYKYPWIVSKSIQRNYRGTFSYLEGKKVPRGSITRAIQTFPLMLGCTNNMFKPMMEQFSELGLNSIELGKIVGSSPQLLLRKRQDILKVLSFLHDNGLDKEATQKILVRCPEIFSANIEKTLMKKTEFLSSLGILKQKIPRVIKFYPELFVSDVNMTLVSRVNYLLSTGLSRKDVAKMISRFSPILGYSIDKVLKPKLDYLVMTMNKPAKTVTEYPRYFSYSLEKKIKPRYMALQSRNINCSLKEMLGKNDEEFAADFLFAVADADAMLE
ncbi:hypothetical protein V2J09_010841 [Rumex salicifolius]